MKKPKSSFLIAIFMMLLMVSPIIYCQDFTQKELKKDATEWYEDPDAPKTYIAKFGPFPIPLTRKEHTVNLIIPLDVEILNVFMKLSPQEGEIPTDVTIALGRESIANLPGEFAGFKCGDEEKLCSGELKDSMNKYLKENQENGKSTISVPLMFTSQQRGTIICEEFSLGYKIRVVEELESVQDVEGIPVCFFWKQGAGPGPTYDLDILSERDFSDSAEVLLEPEQPKEIVSAFYKLTEKEISYLRDTLESGKTYYWRVRVVYDFGTSQREIDEFTLRPDPVKNIKIEREDKSYFTFSWDRVEAEYYEVELNNEFTEECTTNYCEIEKTYMYPDKSNLLVVRAVSRGMKSKPSAYAFELEVNKLDTPEILSPKFGELGEERKFRFEWNRVDRANKYEIEVLDILGHNIELPIKDGKEESVEVEAPLYSSSVIYDPWEHGVPGFRFGEIYMWQVKATNNDVESDRAFEVFIYQPMFVLILMLCASAGAVPAGLIRIYKEDRDKKKRKGRKRKSHRDSQILKDLAVTVFIGVMFYLVVNLTLGKALILQIPFYSYPGSFAIGFIGGLYSDKIINLFPV